VPGETGSRACLSAGLKSQGCKSFCVAATGPFAVYAERASRFRYFQSRLLVQMPTSHGAGTVRIDPSANGFDPLATLAPVADVLCHRTSGLLHLGRPGPLVRFLAGSHGRAETDTTELAQAGCRF